MKRIAKMVTSMVLSRKIIKPSSCTPAPLKRHNLSLFDHVMNPSYIPIASFYPKSANYDINQVNHILENSLSKVLSSYYPFAGRIIDDKYIDCNDKGVEYLNVRISCPMSEILNHTYNDAIDVVFPKDLPWSTSFKGSILVVQLSHFDCGGVSIGICMTHKITDGYSVSKFLNDWAAITRNLDLKPSPRFNAASFFPVMDDPPIRSNFVLEPQGLLSKMYHFSSSSLNLLKNTVAMNLRPPFPLETIANFSTFFSVTSTTEDEIQIPHFVAQLRKSKQQCRDKWKDMSQDQLVSSALGFNQVFEENIYDTYICSSLCNFRLNETDFGWGRPIRVTLSSHPVKNVFIFFDDQRGDGINVLATLTQDDMLVFQSNKELLEFASPISPSVPE